MQGTGLEMSRGTTLIPVFRTGSQLCVTCTIRHCLSCPEIPDRPQPCGSGGKFDILSELKETYSRWSLLSERKTERY